MFAPDLVTRSGPFRYDTNKYNGHACARNKAGVKFCNTTWDVTTVMSCHATRFSFMTITSIVT